MSTSIYVGNLSYDMTEEGLKDLFSQHGEVKSAKIIDDKFTGRSKGFAFVEMTNPEEAKTAIAALDGASVLNRNIKVNIAQPRSNDRPRSGGDRDRGDRNWR